MKSHIPNLLTLANLLCGLLAVQEILVNQNLEIAAYFVLTGLVFDFLDGFVARLLKVSGELGKQMDSLADMVTFGVVPGFIAFSILEDLDFIFPPVAFLITLFSAIRLAKFNLDTRQSDSFIGLPTPANTIIWISIPFILNSNAQGLNQVFANPYVLVTLVLLLSWLLIAELPLLALKFKNMSWAANKIRWIFLGGAMLILIGLGLLYQNLFIPLPFVMIWYILVSMVTTHRTAKAV